MSAGCAAGAAGEVRRVHAEAYRCLPRAVGVVSLGRADTPAGRVFMYQASGCGAQLRYGCGPHPDPYRNWLCMPQ